jgi:predicted nucleic acid-binding protein
VTELVLDASAGIEMITRTETGRQLAALIPAAATLWVPDGLASRARQLRANITFPDACYVALAEALHCPLLTADQRRGDRLYVAFEPGTELVEMECGQYFDQP